MTNIIISSLECAVSQDSDHEPILELSALECQAISGGQGCAGSTRLNKGKSTLPHKGVTTVGSIYGTCGVNMSCPEPDSGGGICGVNMSC